MIGVNPSVPTQDLMISFMQIISSQFLKTGLLLYTLSNYCFACQTMSLLTLFTFYLFLNNSKQIGVI